MNRRLEYKTPRASVRGVFLCEGIAAPVSGWPTIKNGVVQYYEYEDAGVENPSDQDVRLF
jgi:hypothetical protein